jgi:hypothetical protein
LYFPLLIFSIGIATSIILLVQISMYEKSKDTSSSTPSDQTNEFKFPDPKSVYNNK